MWFVQCQTRVIESMLHLHRDTYTGVRSGRRGVFGKVCPVNPSEGEHERFIECRDDVTHERHEE